MFEYVLTDGNGSYIRFDTYSGKYVPVRNEVMADRWDSRAKAANILKNGVNKQLRKKYRVKELQITKTITTIQPKNVDKNVVKVSDLHIDKVKDIINMEYEDTQIDKWQNGLSDMKNFVMDAENRREELTKAVSDIDKEITDIQHYIEFNNMNAYQGWLAYKMLQNRLRKRRKIKNELQVLTQLGNCKIDSNMLADITRAIDEIDNKVYTPRVLTELFE